MEAVELHDSRHSAWARSLVALCCTLVVIGLVYAPTAAAMARIWSTSDTHAHGFLVLPISLWLCWRRRNLLAALTPQPQPWAMLALAGLSLLWLAAHLLAVNAAMQFAFVAILVAAVWAVMGNVVTKAILFPLAFLFFAVPFGEFMLQPMMEWTADFVVVALRLSGIPVYREGLQFVIPTGNWSVIDECSGVRYLIAAVMVGSLFAYLNYQSTKRRALFVLVSFLVPIVANWLRAYLIVMMGHLSNNRIAVGVDHLLYGWVFFGVVIFLLFTIGMRWAEPEQDQAAQVAAATAGSRTTEPSTLGATARVLASATAILALPWLVQWKLQTADAEAAPPRLSWPAQLASGWNTGVADPVPGWKASFPGAALQERRAWQGSAGLAGVHIAYFRSQTPTAKLVSSVNGVVGINDRVWNRVSGGSIEVPTESGTLKLAKTEVLGPQAEGGRRRHRLTVWSGYWIDGTWVTSDVVAKLRNAAARLRGRGDDGAIVLFYSDEATPEASDAVLRSFVTANLQAIERTLAQTRSAR